MFLLIFSRIFSWQNTAQIIENLCLISRVWKNWFWEFFSPDFSLPLQRNQFSEVLNAILEVGKLSSFLFFCVSIVYNFISFYFYSNFVFIVKWVSLRFYVVEYCFFIQFDNVFFFIGMLRFNFKLLIDIVDLKLLTCYFYLSHLFIALSLVLSLCFSPSFGFFFLWFHFISLLALVLWVFCFLFRFVFSGCFIIFSTSL